MKISKTTTWLGAIFIPLLAAIIVRSILYACWWQSPVRYYSNILGLDMQTTLLIGGWLYQGFSIFTIHKFMIAAIMFFNHGQHSPEALTLVQLVLGAMTATVTAWCALHLTGRRIWAAGAGLIAATYAPALLHECLTLRESTQTFFAALSLLGLLWGRKRHFDFVGIMAAGTGLSLPCLVRVSSAPFCILGGLWIGVYLLRKYRWQRLSLKQMLARTGTLVAVGGVIFGAVMLFNARNSSCAMPFHVDLGYALKLSRIENPKDMNVGPLPAPVSGSEVKPAAAKSPAFGVARHVKNCLVKLYLLFKPFEIPNNVNYYFMKYQLFPLQYLTGPLLVAPLAFTAILFMLATGQWRRKEGILLLYVLAYSLPLAFFYPLARYRLIMYPAFAILMFFPFYAAYDLMRRHRSALPALPALLLWAFVLLITFPHEIELRATDFVAYGKALQYQAGGKATEQAGKYFQQAIEQEPDYLPGYINYADNLIKMGYYRQADSLLAGVYVRFGGGGGIAYYYGIALLAVGDPARAERILREMTPPENEAGAQYYYYLGEALRLQHKLSEALRAYQSGLQLATGQKRNILQSAIDKLNARIPAAER